MSFIMGAFAVILFLVIIALCSKKDISGNKYVCPKCKKCFYPKKKKHIYLHNMSNESAFLRCPHCQKISLCNVSHTPDEEEDI